MVEAMINYWAVLVAAVMSMGLGAFWYSPVGFGKPWMGLMKITEKDVAEAKKKGMMKSGMAKSYGLMFIGSLVTMYVLAHFVDYVGATTTSAALQLGGWIWVGFLAPYALSSVLWENKPWALYFINVGYVLVNLLIGAVILALWA